MIGSDALKARVEEDIGVEIGPDVFDQAERDARRKLDWINDHAGRQYGEDGYGDDYLVILTVEAIRGMALAAWTMDRAREIMAARKGAST